MKPCQFALFLFISASLLSAPALSHIHHGAYKSTILEAPDNGSFTWTGYYAGLNVGAVSHTMNITDTQAATFNATLQQVTNPQPTIGFQVGYRRQMDPTRTSGVYGVELSGNFSNARFSKEYGSTFAVYQLSSKHELNDVWLAQVTGGIASGRTLLFLAAGLSWTDISGTTTNLDSVPFFDSFSVSKKALGTAIGGGVEYAFTRTLSARLKIDVITPNSYTTSDDSGNNYQISNSIVQGSVGLNYKFG